MNEFIRVTDELPKISGKQKAAILLAELGEDAYLKDKIYKLLNLSTEEQQKLRTTMEGLGNYNPDNKLHSLREISVLEEFFNYGIVKGLWTDEDKNRKHNTANTPEEKIKDMVDDNPQGVAQILKNWLDS